MNEIKIYHPTTLKFKMDSSKWWGREIPFGLYGLIDDRSHCAPVIETPTHPIYRDDNANERDRQRTRGSAVAQW